MPVTSLPNQGGLLKGWRSSCNSISATTRPSFSPRNSSTSKTWFPKGTIYLVFSSTPSSHKANRASASSTPIFLSHSKRDVPVGLDFPFTVKKPVSPTIRTRTVRSGWVFKNPCTIRFLERASALYAVEFTKNLRSISIIFKASFPLWP